ncbi:MAG: hypothetical protein KAU48_04980 [Candidatus Thorarchaeota archaeon]|nr:hypothetical protein [Candidatus Thorarchaeota archaeon]
MKSVLDTIEKISRPRYLILGSLVSIIIAIMLGYLTQTMINDVYGDFVILDTRLGGYSLTDIQVTFDGIGIEGLGVWLQIYALDFLFPFVYSVSMMIGINMELNKLEFSAKRFRPLVFLPLAAGIVDYTENILLLSQILSYPNLSALVIVIASVVTQLKWILVLVGFSVIVFLLILIIIRSMKNI